MAEKVFLRFRYGNFRPLLRLFGLGPAFSGMELDDKELRVRFSWAFYSRIPLASIRRVGHDYDFVGGIGVHGFRGQWLVNGAANGLVAIEIAPPVRAWVVGFPVRLTRLRLSVADPVDFIRQLTAATG
jgi:hypothetical protein